MSNESYSVIITAAGSGQRFSKELPKQYVKVGQKTILEHTLDGFIQQNWISHIVVCLAPDDPYFAELPIANHPKIATVIGGAQRWQTVFNALNYLSSRIEANDWVLIHDGVRAALHDADLLQLVDTLKTDLVGGILAAPVKDTMKRSTESGLIIQTVERNQLWHALTPQMFRYQLLHDAILQCVSDGIAMTDDASAIEYCGYTPKIVPAEYPNPKLTFMSDLSYLAHLLQQKLAVK